MSIKGSQTPRGALTGFTTGGGDPSVKGLHTASPAGKIIHLKSVVKNVFARNSRFGGLFIEVITHC